MTRRASGRLPTIPLLSRCSCQKDRRRRHGGEAQEPVSDLRMAFVSAPEDNKDTSHIVGIPQETFERVHATLKQTHCPLIDDLVLIVVVIKTALLKPVIDEAFFVAHKLVH